MDTAWMFGYRFRDMLENVKLVMEFGDAGFFDLQTNLFFNKDISSQPHSRGSAVAKLVDDLVSIAVQQVINMNRM